QVDVPASLHVPDVGAVAPGDEVGRAADRPEGPHRTVHAAGDDALGTGEELVVGDHARRAYGDAREADTSALLGCAPCGDRGGRGRRRPTGCGVRHGRTWWPGSWRRERSAAPRRTAVRTRRTRRTGPERRSATAN